MELVIPEYQLLGITTGKDYIAHPRPAFGFPKGISLATVGNRMRHPDRPLV